METPIENEIEYPYIIKWLELLDFPYEEIEKIINPLTKNHEKEQKKFFEETQEFLYESYPNIGLSLCFKNSKLFSVYLYADYNRKFKKYKGFIPYNLTLNLNNEEIVSKLGEPNQKTGGKTIPIAIAYDNLGLEITFITNNWNDYKSPISFICIYAPENNPKKSICGVCGKEASYFCGECKLVKYCGAICQKIHWKFHKKYCAH